MAGARPSYTASARLPYMAGDHPTKRYRFADGCIDASRQRVVCVREDHGEGCDAKPSDVVNEVVAVALDGSGEMEVRGERFL